jgi:hypothetical protein
METPSFAFAAGVIAVLAHLLLYTALFTSVAYIVARVPGHWPYRTKLFAFGAVAGATFAAAMLFTLMPYLLGALLCYGAKVCSFSLFAEQLTNALFIAGVQISVLHGVVVCALVVCGFVLLRSRLGRPAPSATQG